MIVTVRGSLARRFARDSSQLDISSLLTPVRSARLIGGPGFSMRVVCNEDEVVSLKLALSSDFVVEPDYVMETFAGGSTKAAASKSRL